MVSFTISKGDTFKEPDSDTLYVSQSDITSSGDDVTMILKSADSGLDYLLSVDVVLEPTSPKIEVNNITITEIISSPSNEETDAELSERINEERALSPTGGSPSDYRKWALDLPLTPYDLRIRKLFIYAKSGDPYTLECFIEQLTTETDLVNPPTDDVPDAIKKALYDASDAANPRGYFMYAENEITSSTQGVTGRKPLGVYDIEISGVDIIDISVVITGLSAGTEQESDLFSRIQTSIHSYIYNIRPRVPGADNPNSIQDTITENNLIALVNSVMDDNQYFITLQVFEGGARISTPYEGQRRFSGAEVPSVTVTQG